MNTDIYLSDHPKFLPARLAFHLIPSLCRTSRIRGSRFYHCLGLLALVMPYSYASQSVARRTVQCAHLLTDLKFAKPEIKRDLLSLFSTFFLREAREEGTLRTLLA